MSNEFAAWVAGVYCPPLAELPKMRPAGTPRDTVAAVQCPDVLPDGCTASWLTRVFYAGGQLGPGSMRAKGQTAVVHAIHDMQDVSDGKRTCFQFNVTYGGGRGRGVQGEEVGLPSEFILKLYDETVNVSQTARSNRDRLLGRAATPMDHPICFWAALAPPAHCSAAPLVDSQTLTLEDWLRDYCGFGALEEKEKQLALGVSAGEGSDMASEVATNASPRSEYSEVDQADEGMEPLVTDPANETDFFDIDETEVQEVFIVDRYARELRSALGARRDIVAFMEVLETDYLDPDKFRESHIEAMLTAREALFKATGGRPLHAAVLIGQPVVSPASQFSTAEAASG